MVQVDGTVIGIVSENTQYIDMWAADTREIMLDEAFLDAFAGLATEDITELFKRIYEAGAPEWRRALNPNQCRGNCVTNLDIMMLVRKLGGDPAQARAWREFLYCPV